MKKILIADDDVHIVDMLTEALSQKGYLVVSAYSGTETLLQAEKEKPDVILLDLMMPGLSGDRVLENLKGIPVIVVSAVADVDDKVRLLTRGAADYVTKPFDIKELCARIEVSLRRKNPVLNSPVTFDGIELNPQSGLVSAGGRPIKLTRTEYALLKQLMASPDRVIAKSRLLDRISSDTPDCTESSLKIHVSNLRNKLREATGKTYIASVWGIGYKMEI